MSPVLTLRHHFTLSFSRKALLITSGVKHILTIQRSRFLSWLILRTNLRRWIIKPSLKRLNLTVVSFWSAWLAFFPLFYLSTEKERKREKERSFALLAWSLLSLSLLSLIISSSLDEAVQSLSLDSIHDSPSFSTFSSLSSSVLLLIYSPVDLNLKASSFIESKDLCLSKLGTLHDSVSYRALCSWAEIQIHELSWKCVDLELMFLI